MPKRKKAERDYEFPSLPECHCDNKKCRTYYLKECQLDYMSELLDKLDSKIKKSSEYIERAMKRLE